MVYCLRSYVQILEEVLHPDKYHKKWILDDNKLPQVQSLWETASFLRDFLDKASPLILGRIALLEDQIMDAAEKAEDTLETYLTSQLLSNPEGQAFAISPSDLEEAIQAFEDAKQEVIKIMDAEPVQRPDENMLLPVSTTRYPSHDNLVVGVTEDLKQLRSRITSRVSELDIIPIIGMGGMGKTTLARILYDEYASRNSIFDCCAWVTVSQTYDPKQVLNTILGCMPENIRQLDNDSVVNLYKTLYGRRYLIVLDDIWSQKAWNDVQMAFPRDNKKSRIILTTREKTVVDCVNSKCHEMHLISKDESWELLMGKVFGEESCPRELEEVGKNVANSCGGLPLALQVIGGLLSNSQKNIEFWEHVGNNVKSLVVETNDQFSGIFDWSFTHLPHYLKPCFLYMAGFEEDDEISVSRIIKLWVSEGFLYPIPDKSLEDAAMIHLNALVDRSLIFVRERRKSGRVKSVGIHDLLRDLCLRKAQEKKFLYFKDLETDNRQEDVYVGRIISVLGGGIYPLSKLMPLTRSFRCYNENSKNVLSCLCVKSSLVRVLNLGYSYFDEFPVVILQLINLRYLHIRTVTPMSISVLRNLQTLKTYKISSLAMISNMPQLRHLKFDRMEEEDSEIPAFGVHENLQSLSEVPSTDVRKLLGKLPNLRKISINFIGDEEFIDLTCFHYLETLKCLWLSRGMTFPVSLKKLSLEWCKVEQSLLEQIGALPNLSILKFDSNWEPIDWEPCEGGFRELKYLKFFRWGAVNWLANEVHFPVLEQIVLKQCYQLIEIPNEFGDIATLKVIKVDECLPSVFESARRIYEYKSQFDKTDLQLRLGLDTVEYAKQEKERREKREKEGECKLEPPYHFVMDSFNVDATIPFSQPEANLHNFEMDIQEDHQDVEVNASARHADKDPENKFKVWNFFMQFKEDGKNKARCKKCNFVDTNLGITNMMQHVKDFCPFRVGTTFTDEEEFNQDTFRKQLADAIVTHNLPFKFAEYKKIRKVFSYLNPNVEDICRNTSKADILDIYNGGKEELKKILNSVSGRVCLTSDLWTSITSTEYMTLTAHFVDKSWVLRCKLLVFRQLPPPHDGQSISDTLINLLQEWGIEKKVFTITLDNASYYDSAVEMLKNHLRLTNSLLCDGAYMHVRCSSHILNLVVQSGLKTLDESIYKVRKTIKFVKGGSSRRKTFDDCVKLLNIQTTKTLQPDVCTRWNSTYIMLEIALSYKLAFALLKLVDKSYIWCPSEEEWKRIVKITALLRPFFKMTQLFSDRLYPTANVYFQNVWKTQMLIRKEMLSEDLAIRAMAEDMMPKFEKYWESYSTILSFALVMDPRYKLNFIEYAFKKLDSNTAAMKLRNLKDELGDLFEEYMITSSMVSSQSPIPRGFDNEMDDDFMDEYDAIQNRDRVNRRRNQLEKYLDEPPLDRIKFADLDVLEYWKNNNTTSPELSAMARDMLSIQITTVASEPAFSDAGRAINKFRNKILPDNAEAILCSRNWCGGSDSDSECEVDEDTRPLS